MLPRPIISAKFALFQLFSRPMCIYSELYDKREREIRKKNINDS